MANPLLAPIRRYAARLRFPQLFLLAGALLLVNLVVPDPIPFVDEVLMALVTLMLGSMKRGDTSGEDTTEPPRAR